MSKKEEKKKNILNKPSPKIVSILLVLALMFFINQRVFIFGVLTAIAGIFGFYHDKINKTVFDFRLSLFLGIIITRYYGLLYTLIFFLLSNILPTFLAGGRIDGPSIVFYIEFFAIFTSVLFFPSINIILLGIILVTIDAILGIFINSFLGVPWILATLAGVVAFTIRSIYFLTLGTAIEFLFRFI